MKFENPQALLLLVSIPTFWVLYVYYLKNRIEYLSLNYSYTSVLNSLSKQPNVWRRIFYPIMLSVIGFCSIFSAAKPIIEIKVPQTNADILLVMDISVSMAADDIEPSRIQVCTEEISSFLKDLPDDARVGLVVFAGQASILSNLTTNKENIIEILNNLDEEDLMLHTDIGNALHIAQCTLIDSEDNITENEKAIVLLTDGESTIESYSATDAAQESIDNNIRVYCVGFGGNQDGIINWINPETEEEMEWKISAMKSEELEEIAEIGGGKFFRAFDQAGLNQVYDDIKEKTITYKNITYDIAYTFSKFALFGLFVLLAFLFKFNWVVKNSI